MPAHAPDSLTNPRQRALWRDISRLFEDYSGDDKSLWPEREGEFLEVLSLVGEKLRSKSDYDFCPKCGSPTIEPDGVSFTNLHCSKCDWQIGITITEMKSPESERTR